MHSYIKIICFYLKTTTTQLPGVRYGHTLLNLNEYVYETGEVIIKYCNWVFKKHHQALRRLDDALIAEPHLWAWVAPGKATAPIIIVLCYVRVCVAQVETQATQRTGRRRCQAGWGWRRWRSTRRWRARCRTVRRRTASGWRAPRWSSPAASPTDPPSARRAAHNAIAILMVISRALYSILLFQNA